MNMSGPMIKKTIAEHVSQWRSMLQSSSVWKSLGRFGPVLPLFVAMLIIAPTGLLVTSMNAHDALSRDDALEEAARRIEQRINTHISALYAVRGLYMGSEKVTRDEFREFLQAIRLNDRAKGVQGVGFAKLEDAHSKGAADKLITEHYQIGQKAWPVRNSPVGAPVVLLEPSTPRSRFVLGFDMYTDPVRKEAMERARKSGDAAVTGPVELIQHHDDFKQSGFVIYLPLYKKGKEHGRSLSDLDGYIFASYTAGDLLKTVLNESPSMDLDAIIYSDSISEKNLLFKNVPTITSPSSHEIEVAGRAWHLMLDFKGTGVAVAESPTGGVLAIGLLLALVSALFVWAQLRRVEVAEMLVQESRARESEKDLLLREMTHRLKNAIARIVSIARMSSRSDETKEEFIDGFSKRLQAMGAAQELLIDAKRGKVELADLLKSELALIGSFSDDTLKIDGPSVELNESQGQALGLVSHELATNAAKYGAIAQNGKLVVSWDAEGVEDERKVAFRWVESGLKQKPQLSKKGFGTKLVDMMVRGQLNGDIDYSNGADQLAVTITIPLPTSAPVMQGGLLR